MQRSQVWGRLGALVLVAGLIAACGNSETGDTDAAADNAASDSSVATSSDSGDSNAENSDPADEADADGECVPAHPGLTTVDPGKLTVGIFTYPPFAYMEGDEPHGAEVEIIRKIADMECLELAVGEGSFSSQIPNIKDGRLDTSLGSWYRTKERSELIRLGAPVILGQLAIVSKEGYSSLDQLKDNDVKIGSVGGFTFVTPLKEFLDGKLAEYPDNQAVFSDLKNGRLEAIMGTNAAAKRTLEVMGISEEFQVVILEETPVLDETTNVPQTNFPVSWDNEALGDAINENITTLREDGTIKDIVVPFGIDASAVDVGIPRMVGCPVGKATITQCED